MNAPIPEAASEQLFAAQSDVNVELNKSAEQEKPFAPVEDNTKRKIEIDADRIRSSIARLTSTSIGDLEGLASELQKLDAFLRSETERVQHEIENVLAGIKIIVDAITPWKRTPTAPAGAARPASTGARSLTSQGLGDARRGR
jgi:hypothetical protein